MASIYFDVLSGFQSQIRLTVIADNSGLSPGTASRLFLYDSWKHNYGFGFSFLHKKVPANIFKYYLHLKVANLNKTFLQAIGLLLIHIMNWISYRSSAITAVKMDLFADGPIAQAPPARQREDILTTITRASDVTEHLHQHRNRVLETRTSRLDNAHIENWVISFRVVLLLYKLNKWPLKKDAVPCMGQNQHLSLRNWGCNQDTNVWFY